MIASARRHRSAQRGAALLMALIIVTVVTTLATSMVWQQWRSVQVETASRVQQQAEWMLTGGMEYARLYLKSDNQKSDHLNEPWAVPLAEARLSTFLAADENNTDDAPDVFLAGSMTDAQSRFNLRNLMDNDGGFDKPAGEAFLRLCSNLDVSAATCTRIAGSVRDALSGAVVPPLPKASPNPDPLLMPNRVEDLAWLGIDAESIRRLTPYVVILPESTKVNLNTASREVLAAVIPGLDLGSAEKLVQVRQRTPFETTQDAERQLPGVQVSALLLVDVKTNFFFVTGRLRTESQVLEQRSLIRRNGRDITAEWREWVNASDPG